MHNNPPRHYPTDTLSSIRRLSRRHVSKQFVPQPHIHTSLPLTTRNPRLNARESLRELGPNIGNSFQLSDLHTKALESSTQLSGGNRTPKVEIIPTPHQLFTDSVILGCRTCIEVTTETEIMA